MIRKTFEQPSAPTEGLQDYHQQGWRRRRRRLVRRIIKAQDDEAELAALLSDALGEIAETVDPVSAAAGDQVVNRVSQEALERAVPSIANLFRRGLIAAGEALERGGRSIVADLFRRNPMAEQSAQAYAYNRIRNVSDDTLTAVRAAVRGGVEIGAGVPQIAGEIRDSIGLTESQAAAVLNYRAEIERGSAKALTRMLRDKRFDGSVRAHISGKTPLSPEKIDQIVARYRQRYVNLRARTIAQTETLRALNSGQRAGMDSLIASGAVDPHQVRKRWIATKDERTRDSHRSLDGQEVAWNESFRTSGGTLIAFPHDPNAPAHEVINCRCTMAIRILPLRD